MALVPSGTGNLLARNLGVPLEVAEALDVAFGPDERTLDVLEAGDQRFVVMAGLGFDAALMHYTNEDLKDQIGWLAYVGGMAKALRRTPRARFTITLDDGPPETGRGIGVLVGNVGQLQAGITLMPDAHPDDGLLDVWCWAPHRAGLAGTGLADPAPPAGLRAAGRHLAGQDGADLLIRRGAGGVRRGHLRSGRRAAGRGAAVRAGAALRAVRDRLRRKHAAADEREQARRRRFAGRTLLVFLSAWWPPHCSWRCCCWSQRRPSS